MERFHLNFYRTYTYEQEEKFVNFKNDRSVHQVGGVNSSSKSNWNQQSKLPKNVVLDLVFLSQFLQIEEAYLEIAFLTVV